MDKDIRPCYAGSKSSGERLKRGIMHARTLIREALGEIDRSSATLSSSGEGGGGSSRNNSEERIMGKYPKLQ